MSHTDTISYKAFMASPYRSIKHESYFEVYDRLLSKYIGKEITFVEIGVLDGGSLFMWRDFFGEKARIIGIEINEGAKVWESHGFEIFIGSQSDPDFWEKFYEQVGEVNVVLDDGGHTYRQQIITVECALPHMVEDGIIIVEDTYTSYQSEYGYPSKYSFVKYAANLADQVNVRTPKLKAQKTESNKVAAVSFFESIVAIETTGGVASRAEGISNNGAILGQSAASLRYADQPLLTKTTGAISGLRFLRKIPVLGSMLTRVGIAINAGLRNLMNKIDNYKLRIYFKN